ncbi:hypothetical protein D1Y78_09615 [Riemerella anatipestifer]|nr:hypothetical protein [Riemerella anatipestifer]
MPLGVVNTLQNESSPNPKRVRLCYQKVVNTLQNESSPNHSVNIFNKDSVVNTLQNESSPNLGENVYKEQGSCEYPSNAVHSRTPLKLQQSVS